MKRAALVIAALLALAGCRDPGTLTHRYTGGTVVAVEYLPGGFATAASTIVTSDQIAVAFKGLVPVPIGAELEILQYTSGACRLTWKGHNRTLWLRTCPAVVPA